MRFTVSILALLAFAPAAYSDASLIVPRYVEDTKTAGIQSVYRGEWQYMVGGGDRKSVV